MQMTANTMAVTHFRITASFSANPARIRNNIDWIVIPKMSDIGYGMSCRHPITVVQALRMLSTRSRISSPQSRSVIQDGRTRGFCLAAGSAIDLLVPKLAR
jgi:hypothetical protein